MADGAPRDCVKTTCPYCGVGCGVIIEKSLGDRRAVTVKGDPDHPANFGRLCSKGLALGETVATNGRLLYPQMSGERVSWDEATSHIAGKFRQVIDEHGPDAVAFYVSGQLLTEDYYIANKLMKGYIGSANIDTNSRLCMASSVAGHKRAFGTDTVPGCYEDLEKADLLILTGSNLAWCHPVLFQRILAAKEARPEMQIVVIDPRQTATSEFADLHLQIAPGSDVPLFLGLLKFLNEEGVRDEDFIHQHTQGADDALERAQPFDMTAVAVRTGLTTRLLARFYTLVATREKTVTVYSQGVNQASDGTDRVNAIINCHLLTGRIGNIGAGPFSITGQPNAMGGREVGGLANQLASHLEIDKQEDRDLVKQFWGAPTMAQRQGLKAVDLFDAIHRGDVKAVWIMATNPVVSMPNADYVRAALQKCELVVVSDVMAQTDTGACADILLPSTAWGEKKGMVTNSERRMSRQRAFLAAPGEARDDWRQLCDVASKMGYASGFSFETVHDVFLEYAELCTEQNHGTRDLDLGELTSISTEEYETFSPQQWPITREGHLPEANHRFFADGQFFTPDRKARFVAVEGKSLSNRRSADYPLTLNTGRIRDQWHTMTRTGLAPILGQHIAEPFVEISPEDAAACGVADADLASVSSPNGQMLARVLITTRQQAGNVFVPMHWNDVYAKNARVDALIWADPDPFSGQPALKASGVRVERFDAAWYGFATFVGEDFPSLLDSEHTNYWAAARLGQKDTTINGWRAEMAGKKPMRFRHFIDQLLDEIFGSKASMLEVISMEDAAQYKARFAVFQGNRFVAAFYFSSSPVEVSRAWVGQQLGQEVLLQKRLGLLAGHPGSDEPNRGAIVCSCMNVGVNEINAAIQQGCKTVAAISTMTTAGTNCGSCRSDISCLLKGTVNA